MSAYQRQKKTTPGLLRVTFLMARGVREGANELDMGVRGGGVHGSMWLPQSTFCLCLYAGKTAVVAPELRWGEGDHICEETTKPVMRGALVAPQRAHERAGVRRPRASDGRRQGQTFHASVSLWTPRSAEKDGKSKPVKALQQIQITLIIVYASLFLGCISNCPY